MNLVLHGSDLFNGSSLKNQKVRLFGLSEVLDITVVPYVLYIPYNEKNLINNYEAEIVIHNNRLSVYHNCSNPQSVISVNGHLVPALEYCELDDGDLLVVGDRSYRVSINDNLLNNTFINDPIICFDQLMKDVNNQVNTEMLVRVLKEIELSVQDQWNIKRRILKENYGIDWFTPKDSNLKVLNI